jgi:hypothetical protein
MVANEYARAVLTLLQSLLPPLASGWLAYLSIVNGWRFSTQASHPHLHHPPERNPHPHHPHPHHPHPSLSMDGASRRSLPSPQPSPQPSPSTSLLWQSALTPLLQSLETADSFLLPTWMGEWNEDEPPNAIAVALAALAVSYYVTSAFTIVYAAATSKWLIVSRLI